MSFLLRPLLSLYQNNRATINRAISATWLSGMIWLTLGALPAYPAEWRAVIAAGVLTVGLWTVEWAFYIAVLALLYPLYIISIYVMVLFLAVAVLLRPVVIAHFNQALLVVSVPLLARVRLEAVPALWAGLVWGAGNGMWVGCLAALWFKLLGGMSGLDIDLGVLIQRASPFSPLLNVSMIMDRFHTANSLETLQRLVEPFVTTSFSSSTVALSHLLQILAWGMAGYLIGATTRRRRIDERGLLGRVVCLLVGVALLSAGNLWVPVWLGLQPETTNSDEVMARITSSVVNGLFAMSVVALLDSCRRLLDRPLPQQTRRRRKPAREPAGPAVKGRKPVPLPRRLSEPVRSDQDDDVIMIELD
jgi:hypothetical protein